MFYVTRIAARKILLRVWRSARRPILAVCLVSLWCADAPGTEPPPPSWWAARGATASGAAEDNWAAANLGQLKQMASTARDELNVALPTGAGAPINNLVLGWWDITGADDFAIANLGQLKAVAQPFWDQLIAAGAATSYPWTGSGASPDDFSAANLGQLKNVFHFEIDLDGDGLPDSWEKHFVGNTSSNASTMAANGNGLTLLQCYQMGVDPRPAVSVTASPATLNEGGGSVIFTFARTGSTTAALTVNYALSGAATNGSDYSSLSGVMTIAAGLATGSVSTTILTDSVFEPTEPVTVSVTETGGTYVPGSPASATVTIKDASSAVLARYQADAGFTVSGGTTTWADQSGRGNNATQTSSSAAPTLTAGALNGKPVVHFSGSQFFSLTNLQAGASAGEIIAVLRTSSVTVNTGLWKFGGDANGDFYTGASGAPSDDFGSAARYLEAAPVQNLTQYNIYEVSGTATGWESMIDGIPLTTSPANTFGASTPPLIGLNSSGSYFNGDIAEVLIFNRALSDTERDAARAYLGAKYALFPVPSTPAALQAHTITPTTALISWNSPVANTVPSFAISRQDNHGPWHLVATVNARSFLDNGLVPSVAYSYQVQAINDAGSSAPTAAVRLGRGLPYQGAFPTAGIQLWLMADGAWETPVGFLPDYSGLGHDAYQGALANMPTVISSSLNGKPVLHFSGSQYLPLSSSLLAGSSSAEVTIVLRTASVSVNSGLWHFGTDPAGANYTGADGKVTDDFGSTTRSTETPLTQDLTQFHIYEVSSQSGLWQSWLDGQPFYSTSTNTYAISSAPLLGANGVGGYFSGDIAEIIVHNRTLSDAERQTLRQYLDAKYLFPGLDLDQDGLTNSQELAIGTDPYNPDTNYDGIPDGWEFWLGFSPLANDVDHDGLPNGQERRRPSNPFSNNSDRDGLGDLADFYPTDSTRTAPPPGATAPTITLTSPAGIGLLP